MPFSLSPLFMVETIAVIVSVNKNYVPDWSTKRPVICKYYRVVRAKYVQNDTPTGDDGDDRDVYLQTMQSAVVIGSLTI